MARQDIIDLQDLGAEDAPRAGGKAAALGELMRIDGVRVPPGFCVCAGAPAAAAAARILPDVAYAVRSSATAEDSAAASFAGQHDSVLNVVGAEDVVAAVERVRASLLTPRAVAYRQQQGITDTQMAVVVQHMVQPLAAGVLFTADPLTGNRQVARVDAVPGLAEELVSGRVTPDSYTVRDGAVIARTLITGHAALTDAHAVELVALGRRIAAHLGGPQDIEWCLDADGFAIVQSRPITTLYPVPASASDGAPHVYVSVGHQQMMTDAMKPLGLSLWQLTATPVMHEAGGRLFVDVAARVATPAGRAAMLDLWGRSDPLARDALESALAGGLVALRPDPPAPTGARAPEPPPPITADAGIVARLVQQSEEVVAQLQATMDSASGPEVFTIIREDIRVLKQRLFDTERHQAIMASHEATWWLNEHLQEWLGETNAADTLTLSAPGNITSEMGLALLDLADAVRGRDEVAGPELDAFLQRYGMRGPGEIDITRPRYAETPETVVAMVDRAIAQFAPGEALRRWEEGRRAAEAMERDVLTRLRELPDGAAKAAQAKEQIDLLRTFVGYREHPKYDIVSRSAVYKQGLLREIDRLVAAGVLSCREDAFHLRFEELEAVVAGAPADPELIADRRRAHLVDQTLDPPRVLTSEGEAHHGAYARHDLPPGALPGLAVSRGVVEGRARIVADVTAAGLGAGDILITAYTDPSWTPLMLAVAGLVTEVGGVMSHGAVVAREYGLPTVVGVQRATQLIPEGARIRVNGTDGHVEILDAAPGR